MQWLAIHLSHFTTSRKEQGKIRSIVQTCQTFGQAEGQSPTLFPDTLPTLLYNTLLHLASLSNTSLQHSSPTLLCKTSLQHFSTTLFPKTLPTLLYNTLLHNTSLQHSSPTLLSKTSLQHFSKLFLQWLFLTASVRHFIGLFYWLPVTFLPGAWRARLPELGLCSQDSMH